MSYKFKIDTGLILYFDFNFIMLLMKPHNKTTWESKVTMK